MQRNKSRTALSVIARNVRRARKKLGCNQSDLARMLGMAKQSVSNWESARTKPSHENIIQLAKLIGVKPGWFYEEHGEEQGADDQNTKSRVYRTIAASEGLVPLLPGADTAAGVLCGELSPEKVRVRHYISSGGPLRKRNRGVAIVVEDTANQPTILPGDKLIIEPFEPSDIKPGSIVMAVSKGRPVLGEWRPAEMGILHMGTVRPINDKVWPAVVLDEGDQLVGCVTARIEHMPQAR